MHPKKKVHSSEKPNLHPRNKNRGRYDFSWLIAVCPELEPFVGLNDYGDESIDFADPQAVKALNKALLLANYGLAYWNIPEGYLCPPIPGRADYIHHMADLLAHSNQGQIPTGSAITCLDVGVGANCIYPILGALEYGWSFIGSDIDPEALKSAATIVAENHALIGKINFRHQPNVSDIFRGIIEAEERFDLTICNPPFHASAAEAQAGTMRKLHNLNKQKPGKVKLNFGGRHNELWCEGGEASFVRRMIQQSRQFANSCYWFSSLISKKENLPTVYRTLKQAGATEVEILPMGQGQKSSRIVAWTFLSKEAGSNWENSRWK
ncbi:23S rRNA (adenine(1618)-N(6))-methyltransferase RlmF [Sunxiuqinia sp. sy24]|uniref:23S rRNA (adenine(1618)-N(6))-methyltransferase RlmF n=1 Tax=Sunxiuqinia sp. sy24 TaxID=3461495 RepID=UPI004045287C